MELLAEYPLLTNAVSGAFIGALGNLISQLITKTWPLRYRSIYAFAMSSMVVMAPVSHYMFIYMEVMFPPDLPYSFIKSMLFERFIFSPLFMVPMLYSMPFFEGKTHSVNMREMKAFYWPALMDNYKVWTPIIIINMYIIPIQFRVLFMNIVGFVWGIYYAGKMMRMQDQLHHNNADNQQKKTT